MGAWLGERDRMRLEQPLHEILMAQYKADTDRLLRNLGEPRTAALVSSSTSGP